MLPLAGDVHEMPVPASYNDITTNSSIRDYVGWAWYSTQFYVDPGWQEDSRVVLRFGSVHYTAMVYLNGEFVTEHSGGHLPFQAEYIQAWFNFLYYYDLIGRELIVVKYFRQIFLLCHREPAA